LGYRVDYAGHSVVLSGDTRFSENLIKHAAGADVLIHEVVLGDPAPLIARGFSAQLADAIINHHTTAYQTGIVFNRVKPRLAVYAHGDIDMGPPTVAEARKNYSGALEIADDLMTVVIGQAVEVRRRAP
jgi:ribonuclease Z